MASDVNTTDILRNHTAAGWNNNSDHAPQFAEIPTGLIVVLRIVLSSFFCLGVAGNLLIIASIATTRSLHKVPNIYICNLAASDLTLCTVAMPSTFVGYSLQIPEEVCEVLAQIIFSCIIVSLMSITMVAVNRYVLVVLQRDHYDTIYTTKNVARSIAAIWLLGMLYGLPPHFGFGEYEYNAKMGGCFLRQDTFESWMFTKIFGMGFAFLPAMLVSLFCYINIGAVFRRARRKLAAGSETVHSVQDEAPCSTMHGDMAGKQHASQAQGRSTSKHDGAAKRKSTVNLLRKLAVVWGLFMCCWLPVALATSADYTGQVDPRVLHAAFVIAQCNSALNVIIYGALSKDIRIACRRTLTCKRE